MSAAGASLPGTKGPLDPRAYQAAFQLSAEATAFVDEQERVVTLNQAFAQLLGAGLGEGAPFADGFLPSEAARVRGLLRTAHQWSEATAPAVRTERGPMDLRASSFVMRNGERLLLVGARSATARLEAERLHEAAVLAARACNKATTWAELSRGAEATVLRVLPQATGMARLRRIAGEWRVVGATGALARWSALGRFAPDSVWARFGEEGESVLVADAALEFSGEDAGLDAEADVAAVIASPISGSGDAQGIVVATAGEVAAFSLHDVRCLEAVTREMASASARLEAHGALEASHERLRHAFQENEELLARVSRLNAELEDFAMWTTHDLREPLRGLATLAEFLAKDATKGGTDGLRDLAEQLEASATRLKDHIRSLHEFHELARDSSRREAVEMGQLVETVRTMPGAEGAAFTVAAAEARVRADPERVVRAIADMVRFAASRAARPATVDVREGAPGLLHVSVALGVELTGRAAEAAFHVVGQSPSLALARRIALQHGGALSVETHPLPRLVMSLPKQP